MCGRYSLTTAPEAMRRLFGTKGALPNYPARFNIAPTQAAPVVRTDETGSRELVPLRRGLVPPWSKGLDGRCSMITRAPRRSRRSRLTAARFASDAASCRRTGSTNGRRRAGSSSPIASRSVTAGFSPSPGSGTAAGSGRSAGRVGRPTRGVARAAVCRCATTEPETEAADFLKYSKVKKPALAASPARARSDRIESIRSLESCSTSTK